MVTRTKVVGLPPEIHLQPKKIGEILVHCACYSLVTVPIMPGFLVRVRCVCGRFISQLWPNRLSRWMLLEID